MSIIKEDKLSAESAGLAAVNVEGIISWGRDVEEAGEMAIV